MSDELGYYTKGSRKALGAMNAKLRAKVGRLERELAAYQRAQQPQSAEPVGWRDPAYDWSTCSAEMKKAHPEKTYALTDPLYTTPQPSAGVVMPERKECDDGYPSDDWLMASAWNACLDEFARLNGKGVVR